MARTEKSASRCIAGVIGQIDFFFIEATLGEVRKHTCSGLETTTEGKVRLNGETTSPDFV